jgi:ribosomal protein L40E
MFCAHIHGKLILDAFPASTVDLYRIYDMPIVLRTLLKCDTCHKGQAGKPSFAARCRRGCFTLLLGRRVILFKVVNKAC